MLALLSEETENGLIQYNVVNQFVLNKNTHA